MPSLEARIIPGVDHVPREAWERLTAAAPPFYEWGFLHACEAASATPEHGVLPQHVTLYEQGELIAALPLYLKGDGRAEFIYDWHWHQLARRVGVDYYPKAVSMPPFTPVYGAHTLVAPGRDPAELRELLVGVVEQWAHEHELAGVHHLFLTEEEADAFEARGYLRRLTFQLHWRNEGYADFDAFLARFRHKDRVKIKRERRRVREEGVRIEVRRGEAITAADIEAMFAFYSRTCLEHGTGSDYLKRGTWERLLDGWRERLVLFLAWRGGERVGGSLCVHKGEELYGRYWGAREPISGLHFELAFYAPMELAIREGWARLFVGSGNTRTKFARGLLPWPTHSAHLVFDPKLALLLARHLQADRIAMQAEIEAVQAASRLKPLAGPPPRS